MSRYTLVLAAAIAVSAVAQERPTVREDLAALGPWAHAIGLTLGSPKIGTAPALAVAGGPAAGTAHILLGSGPAHVPLPWDIVLLMDPAVLLGPLSLPLNAQGGASAPLAIPNDAGLVGRLAFLQAFAFHGAAFSASNAVELLICP